MENVFFNSKRPVYATSIQQCISRLIVKSHRRGIGGFWIFPIALKCGRRLDSTIADEPAKSDTSIFNNWSRASRLGVILRWGTSYAILNPKLNRVIIISSVWCLVPRHYHSIGPEGQTSAGHESKLEIVFHENCIYVVCRSWAIICVIPCVYGIALQYFGEQTLYLLITKYDT